MPTLITALNTSSERRQHIALNACRSALDPRPRMRPVRTVAFGSEHIKPWQPKNREEILEAAASVWRLVEAKSHELLASEEREHAQAILVEQAIWLLGADELKDMVFDTLWNLSNSNDKTKKLLIKQLLDSKRYYEADLPSDVTIRLNHLRDKLSGKDYASTLKRYLGLVDWDASLDEDKGSNSENALVELARQAISNPPVLIHELAWATSTEAENAYAFGVQLAKADLNRDFLPILLDHYRSSRPDRFIGLLAGYLKHIRDSDIEFWEATLDTMGSDSNLAMMVPEATWRTGTTERAANRVIDLAERGFIGPKHLGLWGFGTELRILSSEMFLRWLDYLVSHPEPSARNLAINFLYSYFCNDKSSGKLPFEVSQTLLLHRDVLQPGKRGDLDEFRWSEVAKRLIDQEPSVAVTLLEGVLESWTTYERVLGAGSSRLSNLLYNVVAMYPSESWQAISKLIADVKSTRTWCIMHWLQSPAAVFDEPQVSGFHFLRFADVANWINKATKSRTRFLARFVPKTLTLPAGKFTREFLSRYGDDSAVRAELRANFHSRGFTGEASLHYEMAKNHMIAFRNKETDSTVRKFLDEYIDELGSQIEYWRTQEERED